MEDDWRGGRERIHDGPYRLRSDGSYRLKRTDGIDNITSLNKFVYEVDKTFR